MKNTLKSLLLIIIMLACSLGVFVGCGNKYQNMTITSSVASVELIKDDEELNSTTFTITVDGVANDVLKTFNYFFTSENVASVTYGQPDADGKTLVTLSAISGGTTQLTLRTNEGQKSTVIDISVIEKLTGIAINSSYRPVLIAGQSLQIQTSSLVSFFPSSTTQKGIRYYLENPVDGITLNESTGVISADADVPTCQVDINVVSEASPSTIKDSFRLNVLNPITRSNLVISLNSAILSEDATSGLFDNVILSSNTIADCKKTLHVGVTGSNISSQDFEYRISVSSFDTTILNLNKTNSETFSLIGLKAGTTKINISITIVGFSDYSYSLEIPITVYDLPKEILINGKDTFTSAVYDTYANNLGQEVIPTINPRSAYDRRMIVEYDNSKILVRYADYQTVQSGSIINSGTAIYVKAIERDVITGLKFTAVGTQGFDISSLVEKEISLVLTSGISTMSMTTNVKEGLILEDNTFYIQSGTVASLTYVCTPMNASRRGVTLELVNSSSNIAISYSVDNDILITGLSNGYAMVRLVSLNGVKSEIFNIRVFTPSDDVAIQCSSPQENSNVLEKQNKQIEGSTLYTLDSIKIAVGSDIRTNILSNPTNATIYSSLYSFTMGGEGSDSISINTRGTIHAMRISDALATVRSSLCTLKMVDGIVETLEHVLTFDVETVYSVQTVSLDKYYQEVYNGESFIANNNTATLKLSISPAISYLSLESSSITWSVAFDSSQEYVLGEDYIIIDDDFDSLTKHIQFKLNPLETNSFVLAKVTVSVSQFSRYFWQESTIKIKSPEIATGVNISTLLYGENQDSFKFLTKETENETVDYSLYLDNREGINTLAQLENLSSFEQIEEYNTTAQEPISNYYKLNATVNNLLATNQNVSYFVSSSTSCNSLDMVKGSESESVIKVLDDGTIIPIVNGTESGGRKYIHVLPQTSVGEYEHEHCTIIEIIIADGVLYAYEVSTVAQLLKINDDLRKNYVLTDNIDMSGVSFTPFGFDSDANASNLDVDSDAEFTGSIDGNGFEIYNLSIDKQIIKTANDSRTDLYIGFVSKLRGTIKNLNISYRDFNVTATGYDNVYIGGLCGYNANIAAEGVMGVKVEFSVNSIVCDADYCYVGGIVGYNDGYIAPTNQTSIDNYFSGVLNVTYNQIAIVGGIAGVNAGTVRGNYSEQDTISYQNGEINSSAEISVIALNDGTHELKTDQSAVGGVVGANYGTLRNVSSSAYIVAQSDRVGGVVGYNYHLYGYYEDENYITPNGTDYATDYYLLKDIYSRAYVEGYNFVGGVFGKCDFVCDDTGLVISNDYVNWTLSNIRYIFYANSDYNKTQLIGYNYVGGISGNVDLTSNLFANNELVIANNIVHSFNSSNTNIYIKNNTSEVDENIFVGGVIGFGRGFNFSQSYSMANIFVPDIVDDTSNDTTYMNSNANFIGVGGLVGAGHKLSFTNCFAKGNITVNTSRAIVGDSVTKYISGFTNNRYFIEDSLMSSYNFILTNSYSFMTYNVQLPVESGTDIKISGLMTAFVIGANSITVSDSYYLESNNINSSANGAGDCSRTLIEMRTQSTYQNWDFESMWTINASVNNGAPTLQNCQYLQSPTSIIVYIKENTTHHIKVDDISLDPMQTVGSNSKKAIVFYDSENEFNNIFDVKDILSSTALSGEGQLVITSSDENVIQIDDLGRFVILSKGFAIITISSIYDVLVYDKIQINVIDVLNSYYLTRNGNALNEITLYRGSSAALSSIIETNNGAYTGANGVYLYTESTDQALVEVNKLSLNQGISSTTLILESLQSLDKNATVEIVALPYISVKFYDNADNPQSFTYRDTIVFIKEYNKDFTINLKIGASKVSVSKESDIIPLRGMVTLSATIITDDENDKIIVKDENDTLIVTDSVENETKYSCDEYDFELINTTKSAKQPDGTYIIKYDFIIKPNQTYVNIGSGISIDELTKYVTTTVKEFSFIASSNAQLKANYSFTIQPDTLSTISISAFPLGSIVTQGDGTKVYNPQENASNILVPGQEGMLKISLFPEYAGIDYYKITSSTNEQGIKASFEQIVFNQNANNYGQSPYNYQKITDGIILRNVSFQNDENYLFDGNLYVKTLIPSSASVSSIITITVTAIQLINGVEVAGISQSIDLEIEYLPGVSLSYTDNSATKDFVVRGSSVAFDASFKDVDGDRKFQYSAILPLLYNGVAVNEEDSFRKEIRIDADSNTLYVGAGVVSGTKIVITATATRTINGIEQISTDTLTYTVVDYIIESIGVEDTINNKLTVATGSLQPLKVVIYAKMPTPAMNNYEELSPIVKAEIENINEIIDSLQEELSTIVVGENSHNPWYYRQNDQATQSVARNLLNTQYTTFNVSLPEDSPYYQIMGTKIGNTEIIDVYMNYLYKENADGNVYVEITDFDGDLTLHNYAYVDVIDNSTVDNPIPIYDEDDFIECMQSGAGNYILMDDITLTNWETIDASVDSLDGNGYKIILSSFALYSSTGAINLGLFGNVEKDTVLKNIRLYVEDNLYLDLTSYSTVLFGLLASTNEGVINNCEVVSKNGAEITITTALDCTASSSLFVGLNQGYITNSRSGISHFDTQYSTIYFNAQGTVAGFVAQNECKISACIVKNVVIENESEQIFGTVTAGFVGINGGSATISSSYVEGDTVTTQTRLESQKALLGGGGINSYGYVSGFVYSNSGTISDCYSNIPLNTSSRSAGFVYTNSASGNINCCYSACYVENKTKSNMPFTGSDEFDAVQNKGTISCCYYHTTETGNIDTYSKLGEVASSILYTNFASPQYFIGFNIEIGEQSGNTWEYNQSDEEIGVAYPTLSLANRRYTRQRTLQASDEEQNIYVYKDVLNSSYGTINNPIIISKPTDMLLFASSEYTFGTINRNHYIIASDISLSSIVGNNLEKLQDITIMGSIEGNSMRWNDVAIIADPTEAEDTNIKSFGLFKQIGSYVDVQNKSGSIGVFENTNIAKITNLTISVTYMSATKATSVGVLAGEIINSTLYNINIIGEGITVQGLNYVGGLAGRVSGNSNLYGITSNVSVHAANRVAEDISYSISNTISNSITLSFDTVLTNLSLEESYEFANKVTSVATNKDTDKYCSYAGGIVGVYDYYSYEINSLNSTVPTNRSMTIEYSVSRYNYSYGGKRANDLNDAQFRNSKVYGRVSIIGEYSGGVLGYLAGGTYASYISFELTDSTQKILATKVAGGIIAENHGQLAQSQIAYKDDTMDLKDSEYSTAIYESSRDIKHDLFVDETLFDLYGNVKYIGGLVGKNIGTSSIVKSCGIIINCYSRINVENIFARYVGGLVGMNNLGVMNYCYATGNVIAGQEKKDLATGQTIVNWGYAGGLVGYMLGYKNTDFSDVGDIKTVSNTFMYVVSANNWANDFYINDTANSVSDKANYVGSLIGKTAVNLNIENYLKSSRLIFFNRNATDDYTDGLFQDVASLGASETGLVASALNSYNYSFGDYIDCTNSGTLNCYSEWDEKIWDKQAEYFPKIRLVTLYRSGEIWNETDLKAMGSTGIYTLKADIYLTDYWLPIDNFQGTFVSDKKPDGTYYTIYNLNINYNYTKEYKNSTYLGLFGSTGASAIIKNINIVVGSTYKNFENNTMLTDWGNASESEEYNSVRGIKAVGLYDDSLSDSYYSQYVGALIGYAENTVVSNVKITYVSNGDEPNYQTNLQYVGGAIGYANYNCRFSSISVNGMDYESNQIAIFCDNSGETEVYEYFDLYNKFVGGVIGYYKIQNYSLLYRLTSSNWNVNLIATDAINYSDYDNWYVGGIVARSSGTENMNYCNSTNGKVFSNVFGELYIGGLIGECENNITFTNCFSDVLSVGSSINILTNYESAYIGAIAGNNIGSGSVNKFNSDDFTLYAVDGNLFVGGAFGSLSSETEIENVKVDNIDINTTVSSYQVTNAKHIIGGIVGQFAFSSQTVDSFIDSCITNGQITQKSQSTFASANIGGLIGYCASGEDVIISESIANCNITIDNSKTPLSYNIGGVIGLNEQTSTSDNVDKVLITSDIKLIGAVKNCNVGGIVGKTTKQYNVINVYNLVRVIQQNTSLKEYNNIGVMMGDYDYSSVRASDSYYCYDLSLVVERNNLESDFDEVDNTSDILGNNVKYIDLVAMFDDVKVNDEYKAGYLLLDKFGLDCDSFAKLSPRIINSEDTTGASTYGVNSLERYESFDDTQTFAVIVNDITLTSYNGISTNLQNWHLIGDGHIITVNTTNYEMLFNKVSNEDDLPSYLDSAISGIVFAYNFTSNASFYGITQSNEGVIFNCHSTGNITITTDTDDIEYTSICKTNYGSIINCASKLEVAINSKVDNSLATNVYMISKTNSGKINNVFDTSNIVIIGGDNTYSDFSNFVLSNSGTIEDCYSATTLDSALRENMLIYAIAITNSVGSTILNCVYDYYSGHSQMIISNNNWVSYSPKMMATRNDGIPSIIDDDFVNGEVVWKAITVYNYAYPILSSMSPECLDLLSTGTGISYDKAIMINHCGKLDWIRTNYGLYQISYYKQTRSFDMLTPITSTNIGGFTPIFEETIIPTSYLLLLNDEFYTDYYFLGTRQINQHVQYFGQTYEINNLTFDNSTYSGNYYNNVGLFGRLGSAYIVDLGLTNVNINLSSLNNSSDTLQSNVGAVLANAKDAQLFRTYVTGTINVRSVSGYSYINVNIGGLVGSSGSPVTLLQCFNDADISYSNSRSFGKVNVGGLIGYIEPTAVYNYDLYIKKCVNSGDITINATQIYTNSFNIMKFMFSIGSIFGKSGKVALQLDNTYNLGQIYYRNLNESILSVSQSNLSAVDTFAKYSYVSAFGSAYSGLVTGFNLFKSSFYGINNDDTYNEDNNISSSDYEALCATGSTSYSYLTSLKTELFDTTVGTKFNPHKIVQYSDLSAFIASDEEFAIFADDITYNFDDELKGKFSLINKKIDCNSYIIDYKVMSSALEGGSYIINELFTLIDANSIVYNTNLIINETYSDEYRYSVTSSSYAFVCKDNYGILSSINVSSSSVLQTVEISFGTIENDTRKFAILIWNNLGICAKNSVQLSINSTMNLSVSNMASGIAYADLYTSAIAASNSGTISQSTVSGEYYCMVSSYATTIFNANKNATLNLSGIVSQNTGTVYDCTNTMRLIANIVQHRYLTINVAGICAKNSKLLLSNNNTADVYAFGKAKQSITAGVVVENTRGYVLNNINSGHIYNGNDSNLAYVESDVSDSYYSNGTSMGERYDYTSILAGIAGISNSGIVYNNTLQTKLNETYNVLDIDFTYGLSRAARGKIIIGGIVGLSIASDAVVYTSSAVIKLDNDTTSSYDDPTSAIGSVVIGGIVGLGQNSNVILKATVNVDINYTEDSSLIGNGLIYIGSVIGYAQFSNISNGYYVDSTKTNVISNITAEIKSSSYHHAIVRAGGIAGLSYHSAIYNISTNPHVYVENYTIPTENMIAKLFNSTSPNLDSNICIGGLVGYVYNASNIQYNIISNNGDKYVGGNGTAKNIGSANTSLSKDADELTNNLIAYGDSYTVDGVDYRCYNVGVLFGRIADSLSNFDGKRYTYKYRSWTSSLKNSIIIKKNSDNSEVYYLNYAAYNDISQTKSSFEYQQENRYHCDYTFDYKASYMEITCNNNIINVDCAKNGTTNVLENATDVTYDDLYYTLPLSQCGRYTNGYRDGTMSVTAGLFTGGVINSNSLSSILIGNLSGDTVYSDDFAY